MVAIVRISMSGGWFLGYTAIVAVISYLLGHVTGQDG